MLGKTEQFIEKHSRLLFIVLGSIIVVILLYFGFKRFYLMPKEENAQAAMFFAERYFEKETHSTLPLKVMDRTLVLKILLMITE